MGTGAARRAVALVGIVLSFGAASAAYPAAGAHAALRQPPAAVGPAGGAGLVPSPAVLAAAGLRAQTISLTAIVRTLRASLPRADRALLGVTGGQAIAGRTRGVRVVFAGFEPGGTGRAAAVLRGWIARTHAARAALAAGAGVSVAAKRGVSVVTILWRRAARLGFVSVRAATSHARALAARYAGLEDARLFAPQPTTALQRLFAQVRPNGSVSERTALQAVALLYGPIPRVRRPAGPAGVALSGDIATGWILPYLSRLPGTQRRAVAGRLGIRLSARKRPHAALCILCDYGDPTFKENAGLQAIVDKWVSAYESKLGSLGMTVVVGTSTAPSTAFADAFALNDATGAYGQGAPSICRVRAFPKLVSETADGQGWVLAHETFHCFEYRILGAGAWNSQPSAWAMEGLASWAAFAIDPVNWKSAINKILDYIKAPSTSLFQRGYDAVGFWLHLEDLHGPFWSQIPGIVTGGSWEADFNASGANTDDFWTSWGSSVLRTVSGDANWDMLCPCSGGSGSAGYLPDFNGLAPGNFQDLTGQGGGVDAFPYGTSQYKITGGPVVHVAISGSARLSTQHNYTDLGDRWFCTSGADTCKCPPDTTGEIPATDPLEPDALLGLSGDPLTGTYGEVSTYTIDDLCRPKKPPPNNGGGGGGGDGGSGGDPHLITFRSDMYDFQAAGEFTLLKSTNRNDLEIQVRQRPFPHSTAVAVNTALAARVGRTVVEIDSASNHGVSVLINRHRFRGGQARLAGGGRVTLGEVGLIQLPPGVSLNTLCAKFLAGTGLCKLLQALLGTTSTATVRWPDGTTLTVSNSDTSPDAQHWAPALSSQIHVSKQRYGHLTGLLGNTGVPAAREFLSRQGKPFTFTDLEAGGAALYRGFGASWRITQHESLFAYARGKNTRSYTILNFPRSSFDTGGAPTGDRQDAAAACAAVGAKAPKVKQACEYDILATGDNGFAAGAVKLQQTVTGTKTATLPPPPPVLTGIKLGAGGEQTYAAYDLGSGNTYVDWISNDGHSIDVCTMSAAAQSCNGGAGPYQLVDPLASSGGSGPVFFGLAAPVIQPGGQVVIVAEIEGANSAVKPLGYAFAAGDIAWSSPAGGAAFGSPGQGLANGGVLLASSSAAGELPSDGAVALDANTIGVYGYHFPFGNGFTDFTLSTPAPSTTPTPDSTGAYGDRILVNSSGVAAEPDPSVPGQDIVVLTSGSVASSPPPPGCPSGTKNTVGFGVADGTPSALQAQAAWSSAYFAPVSCQAITPVLAGAGGVIGLLDQEGSAFAGASNGSVGFVYRRFDPATKTFGAPVLVSDETQTSLLGAVNVSLAADASGGMYALWADHRGTVLAYSANGGATWSPLALVNLPVGASQQTIIAAGGGNAEIAYTNGGQQYLVPVRYAQLPLATTGN